MRRLTSAATIAVLAACSACLGPVDVSAPTPSPTAPAPGDPGVAPDAGPWAEFVRTATQERLPRATWPSTAKNASVTAAILCHNPASHGATEVDLYHGTRKWADIRRADILFARAFCPEAEAALTRALSGRPGEDPTTTVPAGHSGPAPA